MSYDSGLGLFGRRGDTGGLKDLFGSRLLRRERYHLSSGGEYLARDIGIQLAG